DGIRARTVTGVQTCALPILGEVWVADHLALETQVAVKFIHLDLASSDASIVERFHREAAASAQIKSMHVVQTFDRGVAADGRPRSEERRVGKERRSGETRLA